MFKVYNCIVTAHDLRLVVLAAIICTLASFSAINLLHHSRVAQRAMRPVWLGIAAISTGCGIWATHFIAMLAFSPGIASGYNIALTLLSLVAAIVLTGAAFYVAMLAPFRLRRWVGGAMVGGGIATMHYTGMAAFEVAGTIMWDATLVAVSIWLGAVIGAASLPVGLRSSGRGRKMRLLGALILTLAICSHHFTAMGAVSIIPDPTIEMSDLAIPPAWLAMAVALGSFIIIMFALTAVTVDVRERRRTGLEADRMRSLANAAIEGLMVCNGTAIVTVNNSLARLAGATQVEMIGTDISRWLPSAKAREQLFGGTDTTIETDLRKRNGELSPAELILREIDFGGRPHVAIAVRDLKARREAERHIRYLAHHDALTSLPNRASFNAQLDQQIVAAKAAGHRLAVFYLDLDRFKEVNDLYGHATGDRVLQTVATQVTGLLAKRQSMARLGGDEFAVLIPSIADPAAAGAIAEQIQASIATGLSDGEIDTIQTSIGIAIYPDDAADSETLLTQADTALYRAKTEGRNTFRFFEAAMGAAVRDRRQMEHDLRQAVARDEFRLVYQPQRDVHSGQMVGFEALLRWDHPTRGAVPPGVFIPVAEDSGTILQIGEWVLRTACREAASWSQPLSIAINVSALQIYSENFVQLVHTVLLETGLSPRRLELEITETALVRDLQRALNALRQIKALGVKIAMDDFGTGYSSLSNLRAFPFDKIKIDGSFVKSVNTNEQAATIVRAVLGLGRGLGLPVLAEGVETRAELQFLESEQCTEVQGYLLGRPSDIASFRAVTHGEAATEQPELPFKRAVNE
jgi:diguanylate cyclase (GGDEF)-like protein/PAS domain S-box-containing protein